ncbi:MAG: twin transmembrane helix small protein [Pseudomonadota bacterium]
MKILVLIFLVFILYTLGSGLYYLLNDRGKTDRLVKALTWRIGLSLAIFFLILLAHAMGWLSPQGI